MNRYLCKIQTPNIFKNVDYFVIDLFKKTYKDISSYLIRKFHIIKKKFINESFSTKKLIRIKSIGLFNKTQHLNWLKNKLCGDFILNFDDPNPDYLIYNVFGNEDMNPKYQNAIKIAIYTENVMPDLNYADYIIAHYHINYLL